MKLVVQPWAHELVIETLYTGAYGTVECHKVAETGTKESVNERTQIKISAERKTTRQNVVVDGARWRVD